jgi:hypothetical protein
VRDRVLELAGLAASAIERLARELLARKPGGHLVEEAAGSLELRIPLRLRPARRGSSSLAFEIASRLDRLVQAALEEAVLFRPGNAFCYRCGTGGCVHGQPPSCRHVFAGYGPTGLPEWEDFAQLCLEQRHPDVDRLYEQPPAFVVLLQRGDELRKRLLRPFEDGRRVELLGQVAAGFYRLPARAPSGRNNLALSFQLCALHRRDGLLRLGLNVLGRAPADGVPLEGSWERSAELPWTLPVQWAEHELERLRRGAARLDRDRLVLHADRILRGLAHRLERDQRARARRTRHAERRHLARTRPTPKALEDARRAKAADILFDERNGTYVVPGERGRTHFFAGDGRLVTSVRYSREAIERKRSRGVWREADPAEADRLLSVLSQGDSSVEPPGSR